MRCNDCRGEIGKQERSTRSDVCDGCWDNRMDLVTGRKSATPEQVRAIQRSMAAGRGTAKRRIDRL